MAEDVIEYLQGIKKAIEEIPDETKINDIADKVAERVLEKVNQYTT